MLALPGPKKRASLLNFWTLTTFGAWTGAALTPVHEKDRDATGALTNIKTTGNALHGTALATSDADLNLFADIGGIAS
jgi:hypothetical protein